MDRAAVSMSVGAAIVTEGLPGRHVTVTTPSTPREPPLAGLHAHSLQVRPQRPDAPLFSPKKSPCAACRQAGHGLCSNFSRPRLATRSPGLLGRQACRPCPSGRACAVSGELTPLLGSFRVAFRVVGLGCQVLQGNLILCQCDCSTPGYGIIPCGDPRIPAGGARGAPSTGPLEDALSRRFCCRTFRVRCQ